MIHCSQSEKGCVVVKAFMLLLQENQYHIIPILCITICFSDEPFKISAVTIKPLTDSMPKTVTQQKVNFVHFYTRPQ